MPLVIEGLRTRLQCHKMPWLVQATALNCTCELTYTWLISTLTCCCSRNANVNFVQDLFFYQKYMKGRVIAMALLVRVDNRKGSPGFFVFFGKPHDLLTILPSATHACCHLTGVCMHKGKSWRWSSKRILHDIILHHFEQSVYCSLSRLTISFDNTPFYLMIANKQLRSLLLWQQGPRAQHIREELLVQLYLNLGHVYSAPQQVSRFFYTLLLQAGIDICGNCHLCASDKHFISIELELVVMTMTGLLSCHKETVTLDQK